jgi:hypothetical protein
MKIAKPPNTPRTPAIKSRADFDKAEMSFDRKED